MIKLVTSYDEERRMFFEEKSSFFESNLAIDYFDFLNKKNIIISQGLFNIYLKKAKSFINNNNFYIINDTSEENIKARNVEVLGDYSIIFDKYTYDDEDIYIIGDTSLFKIFLPSTFEIIVFHSFKSFKSENLFPAWDFSKFRISSRSQNSDYIFITYKLKEL